MTKLAWLPLLAAFLSPDISEAQNLFVSAYGGVLYEFTPGGTQSTFAPALNHPFALAFDAAGNLFVASDNLSGGIYKFTNQNGTLSPTAGTFGSGVKFPYSLAFDSAGNLFVGSGGGSVYKYSTNGTQSTFASGVSAPLGLAFDGTGNLFVANYDYYNGSDIFKYTTNGTQSTFASGLNQPAALAFDGAGNLFEADTGSGNIYKFTTNGVRSTFATGLSAPTGLAFDTAGNLFEANYNNGTINKFTNNAGNLSTNATLFASGFAAGQLNNIIIAPTPAPTAAAILLTGARTLANGSFQFAFTNNPGLPFTVLTSTNPSLASTNWTSLGGVTEVSPGQFQFIDPQAANSPLHFYRVRSP